MDIAWIAAGAALWAGVAAMVVGLDRLTADGRTSGTAPSATGARE